MKALYAKKDDRYMVTLPQGCVMLIFDSTEHDFVETILDVAKEMADDEGIATVNEILNYVSTKHCGTLQ